MLKASRKRKHKAYRALVHIIEEVRQRVSSVFDGTLGFPGEAPPTRGQVSIVGFNANGLRSKDRLSVLLREANFRKVDVLLLQEHKFAKKGQRNPNRNSPTSWVHCGGWLEIERKQWRGSGADQTCMPSH